MTKEISHFYILISIKKQNLNKLIIKNINVNKNFKNDILATKALFQII